MNENIIREGERERDRETGVGGWGDRGMEGLTEKQERDTNTKTELKHHQRE